jgi:hypothetical protein
MRLAINHHQNSALNVATDPHTLLETSASSQNRHAPIYSLQLINAVPVTIDASPNSGEKPRWRPIVSRVTRITVGDNEQTAAVIGSPEKQQQKHSVKIANAIRSEPIKRVLAYRSVLRNWIRRVVGRGRTEKSDEVGTVVLAASEQTKVGENDESSEVATVMETATNEEDAAVVVLTEEQAQEEESVLQSLASQEAGADDSSVAKLQPLSCTTSTEETVVETEAPLISSFAASEEVDITNGSEVVKSQFQPTPPKQEKRLLAKKYASIESLEEKAFQILKDLGMIEPSLDFYI